MSLYEWQKISVESLIGLRLDKALAHVAEIQTRSRALYLIENNLVRVNGKYPKPSYIVKSQDDVQIQLPPAKPSELQKLDMDLDILFEDSFVIVLNKPAGLVVHPSAGHEQDTLVNALLSHTTELAMKFGEQRPGIVHRLDKDTSGLLVIAKNDSAHEKLVQQFKNRTIHRIYYAACFSKLIPENGKIQSYLSRHPSQRKIFASLKDSSGKILRDEKSTDVQGKWAITHYQTIKTVNTVSYLKLKLETGRTHQIRVHLSEKGHPLWKDALYGGLKKEKGLPSSTQSMVSQFPRLALHAAELGFQHPQTQEWLQFKCSWPQTEKSHLLEVFGKVEGCF